MINQRYYLDRLFESKDNGSIKIITGMRYTGKTHLLQLYREYLEERGIPAKRIINFSFESADAQMLLDENSLAEDIIGRAVEAEGTFYKPDELTEAGNFEAEPVHYYLFLDEIGKVPGWAAAVNGLRSSLDCDIYIAYTGWLGNIEAATGGAFSEIRVYPVPFNEFLKANGIEAQMSKLQEGRFEIYMERYIKYGALPVSMLASDDTCLTAHLLQGMLSTVIVKDILHEGNVRDIVLLEAIMQYLAEHLGQTLSIKQISDAMTAAGRKTMPDTVDGYLQALLDSGIICGLRRFDVKSDKIMKTGMKYYFGDTGIRNILTEYKQRDYEVLMKNAVYLALCRNGYQVDFARNGVAETDFVAVKGDSRVYVQVAGDMRGEMSRKAQLKQLRSIKDNYRKIIVTAGMLSEKNIGGIECLNILEFLLLAKL